MLKQGGFAISITSGVIVAKEDDTIFDVSQLMKKHNIGAVVILKHEKIVGILSERDVVQRAVCSELPVKKTKVKEIMTRQVITADLKDGLNKIHEIMCSAPFRHLPIVSNGKLIGIVSSRNLIAGLMQKASK